MAKRRGGKSRRKTVPGWLRPPEVDWAQTGHTLMGVAWVTAAIGLIVAWVIGVPRLEAYASSRQPAGETVEGSPDELSVRFVDRPAWLAPELEASLARLAAEQVGSDPLRRSDLVGVRSALLATGWFRDVEQVRRSHHGPVEVTATFARPAAVIRDDRTDHLVNRQGLLLPRSFPAGSAEGFIAIVGARYARPSRAGEPWPGADVTAALQLLQVISARPWAGQVAQIDVARHGRDASLRLVTDRGCTILWGRAPGEEQGGDVPAAQKLSYLDYHHSEYGHIDRGLQELDITGDVVVGR